MPENREQLTERRLKELENQVSGWNDERNVFIYLYPDEVKILLAAYREVQCLRTSHS